MKNREVAASLYEISELLSVKNDNKFKIRAYEMASRILESLTEPIERIASEKKLTEIPGIGRGIAEKIEEYLKNGRISYLDELKKEFPKGFLEVMSVQGLGPKKASLLRDKLNISDITDLKKAVEKKKLRSIKGFGEKTENNIIEGIGLLERSAGRMLLDEASAIADGITGRLNATGAVLRMEPAGSLRRMKETVGDVDILCSVRKGSERKAINAFLDSDNFKKILARGETKASALTPEGIQADLRVVDDSSFGAALQYFTGSKDHNVALRTLAKRKKMTVNEYGVFRISDAKKPVASKTEKEVYSALGLSYIPPELRENRGEIEAALKGDMPKLVENRDIKGDCHVHSSYSDGSDSITEIAEAAEKTGYEWIIVTDHSKSLRVANGLSVDRLLKKIEEVKRINAAGRGVRVLCGTESDILNDGSLDYPDDILEKLDFVIASIHSGFKQSEKQITERAVKALRNPNVDCLGHPTGRLIGKRDAYAINMEEVLKTAKEEGKMLEINAYPERLDLADVYCRKAKEMGITLAIGTDAHAARQLGYMRFGLGVARRGWLEARDVFNTFPLKKLERQLEL
ncbi:MAG: DNA polymerase/3'-5' exonuclease PolX [Endomicrobiales bacterium]|nr:DNA polymerase/3'-5' exonuclease PolX [Endomicrobiales bacterium]